MKKIAEVSGAVAALVALISLAISVSTINSSAQRADVREWQKTVVYEIIGNADPDVGVNFSEIQTFYLNEAQKLIVIDLPKDEIQDISLQRILRELITDESIVKNRQGYFKQQTSTFSTNRNRVLSNKNKSDLEIEILSIVQTDSCRYDPDTLKHKVENTSKLSTKQFYLVITTLLASNKIIKNDEGNICSISK